MPPKKPVIQPRLPRPIPPPLTPDAQAWIDEASQGGVRRPETSRDVAGHPTTSQDTPRRPETPEDTPRRPTSSRAPQGSKVLVERRSGDIKRRVTIYLEPITARRLEEYCDEERHPMSDVVTAAVREYLAKRARR